MTLRRPLRVAVWTCCLLLLAAAVYQFLPDGTSETGIPSGVAPPVRGAMARLQSRRPSRRCDAAFELGRLHAAAAASRLVALLGDGEDAMGPFERVAQGLMLGGTSRPVWNCAMTALQQIGPGATPSLIEAFASSDARVRTRATQVLALSRDPDAIGFLAKHLEDSDPVIRRQALIAVAQGGSRSKADAIQRAFHDPDPEVRILALGYAEPGLGPWVYDAILRAAQDPDPQVRARAGDRIRGWPGARESR